MKFQVKALAVAVLVTPIFAFAQDAAPATPAEAPQTVPAEVATEMNKAVTTHVAPTAQSIVRKDMEDYCKEVGITIGEVTPKGAIYLSGLKRVEVNKTSPDFIRMRALNFSEAYSDAVAKYVMDKMGRALAEQFNETFMDQSSDRLQPARTLKSTEERIEEKVQQLAEAQLDVGLQKLGVTPPPGATVAEKRVLAKKSLIKNSVNDAIGSAAGLLPVQTFEGWDEKGKYALGCIIRGGEETETIAECLYYKQRPVLSRPDKGLTVAEAMPTDAELVSQFGVRLFFDKNGVPALLSFGQWGSAYTGTDEDMADDAMEHAMRQAKAEADDQLTMFINSSITLHEESGRGRVKENAVLFDANGVPTEQTIRGLIDTNLKQARQKGSDTMIGRSTVCEKVIVHPTSGQKIALCVRMWSFGQYDAMKRIIERKRPTLPSAQVVPPQVPAGTSGKNRGRSYDF
ncbi:MAG: DUF6844 domain-containing protein [Kiritimatiellia bacterium]